MDGWWAISSGYDAAFYCGCRSRPSPYPIGKRSSSDEIAGVARMEKELNWLARHGGAAFAATVEGSDEVGSTGVVDSAFSAL
jgi:hypothetical protein